MIRKANGRDAVMSLQFWRATGQLLWTCYPDAIGNYRWRTHALSLRCLCTAGRAVPA